MLQRFLLAVAVHLVGGFTPAPRLAKSPFFSIKTNSVGSLKMTRIDDTKPVECFVVIDEELEVTEGATAQVVCTSEPEEYAWLNGLEVDALKPIDDSMKPVLESTVECVEGALPRGVPVWECHP